jgi:hypothetical protein
MGAKMNHPLYNGFYLLEISDALDRVTGMDGSHNDKDGVKEAMELYQRLGFVKPGHKFYLVSIAKDLPLADGQSWIEKLDDLYQEGSLKLLKIPTTGKSHVNVEAAAIIKSALGRTRMKTPRKTKL